MTDKERLKRIDEAASELYDALDGVCDGCFENAIKDTARKLYEAVWPNGRSLEQILPSLRLRKAKP